MLKSVTFVYLGHLKTTLSIHHIVYVQAIVVTSGVLSFELELPIPLPRRLATAC